MKLTSICKEILIMQFCRITDATHFNMQRNMNFAMVQNNRCNSLKYAKAMGLMKHLIVLDIQLGMYCCRKTDVRSSQTRLPSLFNGRTYTPIKNGSAGNKECIAVEKQMCGRHRQDSHLYSMDEPILQSRMDLQIIIDFYIVTATPFRDSIFVEKIINEGPPIMFT